MADKPTGILVCAILFAVGGILDILGGVVILLTGGAILSMEGVNTEAAGMLAGIAGIFAAIYIIVGVVDLAVAYGIWNMKKWARIAGIILAVISLISFPIGTIIGTVILYFLLIDKKTKNSFVE